MMLLPSEVKADDWRQKRGGCVHRCRGSGCPAVICHTTSSLRCQRSTSTDMRMGIGLEADEDILVDTRWRSKNKTSTPPLFISLISPVRMEGEWMGPPAWRRRAAEGPESCARGMALSRATSSPRRAAQSS
jgi:hypothetical protein